MSEEKAGHAPDVIARQLVIAVQALRSIRDNVSAQTDWRDVETMAGDAIDAIFVLGATPELAEPQRYALVEQMGFRRTYGTVRETEFCGRPMLEVTSLETGAVHLAAPESLYQLTWLTRAQAEAATRTGSHSPAALSAAIADDLASWDADDEYGASAFRGHSPGCACPDCEGARSDAASVTEADL